VFRAVENRVTIVRADVAYDSAVIDPYGRELARRVTPDGEAAVLVADVPLGSGRSPWVTLGPWFGWLCAAWFAAYAWTCCSSRLRSSSPRPADTARLARSSSS
jgi:apolipoprotein N-acyltransferase